MLQITLNTFNLNNNTMTPRRATQYLEKHPFDIYKNGLDICLDGFIGSITEVSLIPTTRLEYKEVERGS
jgi:hypothetical protein